MTKLSYLILLLSCFLQITIQAQTATEAFRLSQSDALGSARNLGVGNSMYSIGADLSAISNNPAGIGAYWRSEFMGSVDVTWNPYDSKLTGDSSLNLVHGSYDYWRMPNLGFVITSQPQNSPWKTANIAIGVNRIAEFAQEIQFQGYSPGSRTDSWQENAFGLDTNQLNRFEEGLALSSGAIYDFEKDLVYEDDNDLNPGYNLYKDEYSAIRGGNSELFLGFGTNLGRVLLLGASMNIPLVNSDFTKVYNENDRFDGIPFFNELHYTSYVNTSGSGINGKFGLFIKPSKFMNLTFAAHTPTKLFLTDNYNTTLTYDYTDQNNDGPIYSPSPYGSFHYALVTPWKLVGAIGIIAGTSGFISAGVQYSDYSTMHYDYSVNGNGNFYAQEERDVNASIKQHYSGVFKLNAGGEIAFKVFRLRGGFSAVQSAYNNDGSFDPTYTGGIGFRWTDFYIDFAYSYTKQDQGYVPYETDEAPQPLAVINYNPQRVVMTTGVKF